MERVSIQYCFTLKDGAKEIFDLRLDAGSLELQGNIPAVPPPWTRLDFHQCPHCPLQPSRHPHCPLAVNLVEMLTASQRLISHDRIHVDVTVGERMISQETTAQRGISSLMGLLIATSGCPWTRFFKPMARFHLPLATVNETVFRAVGSYLLAQYFLKRRGKHFDIDLGGLRNVYDSVHELNIAMTKRLRGIAVGDANVNALIILDLFAQQLPFSIEDELANIEPLFAPYFDEDTASPEDVRD